MTHLRATCRGSTDFARNCIGTCTSTVDSVHGKKFVIYSVHGL
jgi:hypothetical protein